MTHSRLIMLTGSNIVAFVATTNGVKARFFYQQVLGLDFISDDEFATVLTANGVELRIQKVQSFTPHQHTQLGWSVTSIADEVCALRDQRRRVRELSFSSAR